MLAASIRRGAAAVAPRRQLQRAVAAPALLSRGFADGGGAESGSALVTKTTAASVSVPLKPATDGTGIVISGMPTEYVDRPVRIFLPTKEAMQSGKEKTKWRVEYDRASSVSGRWVNPLMGWTSTSDPLSNLQMYFDSKDAAIEYCERQSLSYFVESPKKAKRIKKDYGLNFKYRGPAPGIKGTGRTWAPFVQGDVKI